MFRLSYDDESVNITRSIIAGVVLVSAVIAGGAVSCKVIDHSNPLPVDPKIVEVGGQICTLVEKVKPNDDRFSYNTYECEEKEVQPT